MSEKENSKKNQKKKKISTKEAEGGAAVFSRGVLECGPLW
jgi:hypothetical protein